MTVVNMHAAKSQLSTLVARAEAGEDVVIARDGKPAVRLTPVQPAENWARRVAGMWAGQIWMSEDFDDPRGDCTRRRSRSSWRPATSPSSPSPPGTHRWQAGSPRTTATPSTGR